MSDNIETAVETTCEVEHFATDDILQRRLDVIEILQMTLEDVQCYQSEDSTTDDVSFVIERVEMCCRFLESTPCSCSDRNGTIARIGMKLIDIHVNLSNGKSIGTDCLGTEDWADLGNILTSMKYVEISVNPVSKMIKRNSCSLKLMIADRIVKLLIAGPLEFNNCATLQLLERLELCQRYLYKDDLDLETLRLVSDDILNLVHLSECYEVMEYWETIDFKKWVLKSMETSLHGFSKQITFRKVYSAANIREVKLAFENHWKRTLANKPGDYLSPKMMNGYPDHPYLSYAKKNRSVFNRKSQEVVHEAHHSAQRVGEVVKNQAKPFKVDEPCLTPQIAVVNATREGKLDIHKKFVSIIHSERKMFNSKIKKQKQNYEVSIGGTKTPTFTRVGLPQNLTTILHTSIENFIIAKLNKNKIRSSGNFLQTIFDLKDFCVETTGTFLESVRNHVAKSVLDIMSDYDPPREILIARLMIDISLRVTAFHNAVDQLEKCCNMSSVKNSDVVEMITFSVKNFFKKLAVVCCTDKLVVSS